MGGWLPVSIRSHFCMPWWPVLVRIISFWKCWVASMSWVHGYLWSSEHSRDLRVTVLFVDSQNLIWIVQFICLRLNLRVFPSSRLYNVISICCLAWCHNPFQTVTADRHRIILFSVHLNWTQILWFWFWLNPICKEMNVFGVKLILYFCWEVLLDAFMRDSDVAPMGGREI